MAKRLDIRVEKKRALEMSKSLKWPEFRKSGISTASTDVKETDKIDVQGTA